MPGLMANNTRTSSNPARRIAEFIAGPWSIRPIGFGVISAFLNQFSDVRAAVSAGRAPVMAWLESFPSSMTIGLSLGLSFAALAWAMRRTEPLRRKQLIYHVGIALIAIGFAVAYGLFYNRPFKDVPFNSVRVYLAILVVSIIFGVGEKRVRAQASRVESALAEVDRQRSLLLQADEDTRREVADLLHDRVQAGLVVANLELNKISEKLSEQHRAEIRSIVAELEEIRRFDVRDASRLLSPDIAVQGLNHCISELTQRYRSTMQVSVQLDEYDSEFSVEKLLAIYRICEQGLLNAALHGNADNCLIRTSTDSDGTVVILVENNGAPLSEKPHTAGSGTAVIDAWVSKFGGTWSLTNSGSGQVQLRATLTT